MKKSKHIIRSTVKIVSKIVYLIYRAVIFFFAGAYLSFTARATISEIKLFGLKAGIAFAAQSLITMVILMTIAVVLYLVLYYAARTIKKFIKSISA